MWSRELVRLRLGRRDEGRWQRWRENPSAVEGLEGAGTAACLEVCGVARVMTDQDRVGRTRDPRGMTSHSGANGSKGQGKVMG